MKNQKAFEKAAFYSAIYTVIVYGFTVNFDRIFLNNTEETGFEGAFGVLVMWPFNISAAFISLIMFWWTLNRLNEHKKNKSKPDYWTIFSLIFFAIPVLFLLRIAFLLTFA